MNLGNASRRELVRFVRRHTAEVKQTFVRQSTTPPPRDKTGVNIVDVMFNGGEHYFIDHGCRHGAYLRNDDENVVVFLSNDECAELLEESL